MALETKTPDNNLDPGRDPAEDEFNALIDKNFSPGDERMMEERAKKGSGEDKSLADREASGGEDSGDGFGHSQEEHENQVGRGYKPDNPEKLLGLKPSLKGVFGFARNNRGKLFLGGGAVGISTMLIIGFFILIPFKIMNTVNNLQSRFYASSENAVQHETDVLFSDYIKKYVLPSLTNCSHSTIDRNCTPGSIAGTSPVAKLFKGWKTAHLENKLAENYDIEFKKVGSTYYLKTSNMTGNGASLGTDSSGFATSSETLDDYLSNSKDPEFKRVSRSELRQSYRDALDGETQWKKVLYRYKISGLLEQKYGLKRCIIACNARDNFADWKNNKSKAAKMIIAERVLAPRSQTLALVIGCVLDGSCDPTSQSETDSNGRKQSKIQVQLQQQLAQLAAEDTGKYAAVLAHSNGILNDGYKKYLVKQVVKSLGGKEASDVAADKVAGLVPVIGWINTASNTIGTLEKAPQKIKVLSYMTNATAMVSLYTTYRVFADECKSGNCDPAILGSFTDQLGSIGGGALGGTASAEQTPLYQNLIDGKSTGSVASGTYKCNDGKTIPAGSLVCPEEVLGGNSSVLSSINSVLDALGPLKDLANYWNGSIGFLMQKFVNAGAYLFDSILTAVPLYSELENYVSKAAQPIIDAFTNFIIPSPFSDNMGGGRTFDLMAGGADVSGNDYAHNGLGGMALSATQAAAIVNQQTEQNLQDYQSKPLLSRLFDPNSNYSLTTKVAMAMPDSWASAQQTIANMFSNPLGKFGHSFASVFSFKHAFAAAMPAADPFGITQYGYPSGDTNLAQANADPEAYWNQYCSSDGTNLDWTSSTSVNSQWQNNATTDPNTGMPENATTDPCLLLQATTGSAGALFDSSLLTSDDQAVQ